MLALVALLAATAAAPAPAFHVDVTGKGQPIILIPGLASGGGVWDGVVAHYKDGHECHVLTLAGFAGQKPVPAPLVATAEKQLAQYIRDHKLSKPIVVGHSLGGVLALELAAAEPELVGKLVIVDSLPFLPAAQAPGATVETARPQAMGLRQMLVGMQPEQRKNQSAMMSKGMATDPKSQERIAAWSNASDQTAVADAMVELMTTDLRPELKKITAPALVVGTWIAFQQFAKQEQIEATFKDQYAGLAGAKIVIHPTARHFVMLDDEAGLLREMDAFLGAAKH